MWEPCIMSGYHVATHSTQEHCVHMSVIDQLLAFIAEITQYVDLFEAILVFLGFFGITL